MMSAAVPALKSLLFVGVPLLILIGMVGAQLLGRWIGQRRAARAEDVGAEGSAAVEAALLALLGLLVAFSFSGAEGRLQARRALIVEEANAIGTAYLRVDLLPDGERPAVKALFRRYVDARIAYYRQLLDTQAARMHKARAQDLQQQLWTAMLAGASRAAGERATLLVVPSLNSMIDVTSARDAALWMHIPLPVFVLLAVLSAICALFVGMGMAAARRVSLLHVFAFAGTLALTAYVILNIEFPRLGFVRFEPLDALLADVRAAMN